MKHFSGAGRGKQHVNWHDEALLRENVAKNPKGWMVQSSSGP